MARANPVPKPTTASSPFVYPTPAMVAGYVEGASGMPGSATPLLSINTSSMAAPAVGGPMTTQAGGVFATMRQRLAVMILGADGGSILFPPQQPLQPIAQPLPYGAIGRQWDYPSGFNTRVTPRSGAPVTFAALRALADGYDVLRIMIERVKDKVNAQDWSIGMRDEKSARDDATCDEIAEFFAFPDKLHPWDDWLRMLLEQVIVYDAPATWLRPTRGGDLYSVEILDGALISPKIMADGRLPPPEYGPAYQQVIKGLPAIDYIQPVPRGQPVPPDPTGQPFPELYYRPRNMRVDSVYGYSPVEQIIRTVQIGMAQEDWLRDYFTEGSAPDLLIGTPKEWNPAQIQQFQDIYDSLLVSNLANRRKTRFVPGGMEVIDTKEKALMDSAVQEWLVRVMCFALGLNPMPFVKMMNKGQEQTHHTEANEEGLRPWLEWVANFVNGLIAIKWGRRDVVFRWTEQDDTDPKTMAEIDEILIRSKMYHPDERRVARGDAPMPDEMRVQMDMANFNSAPNATVLPPDQQAEADARAEAAAQADAKRLAATKPAPGEKASAKAAEKRDLAVLVKSLMPAPTPAPVVNVAAPVITMPAINFPEIKIAAPTINMPPLPAIKQGDVFVDVGSNIVKIDAPARAPTSKTVTATKTADGRFVGTIVEGARIESDGAGNVVRKDI